MPGRILIADDLATNRIILKARLSAAAYDIAQADTGAEAVAMAQAQTPDLVVLSAAMAAGGAELCRRLKAVPGMAQVPIVVTTADQARAARLEQLEAGADAVMAAPPDIGLLRARIRNLLRRRAAERELAREDAPAFGFAEAPTPALTPPGRVALIASTAAAGLRWKTALAPRIRDRITLLTPDTALAAIDAAAPDAIVMAGGSASAVTLVADLRCRSETLRSAIVLVEDRPDPERTVLALDLGVSDLMETGFDAEELALRLRREMARKARDDRARAALKDGLRLAETDELTGLYNRRYAERALAAVAETAQQSGERFAVMVLDLDRFKSVNDRFGHAAGDVVLRDVAQRMQACLRRQDVLARIGGEEFLAVIRNCDVAQARRAANRLRQSVGGSTVALPGVPGGIAVTVSAGLVMGGNAEAAATLIDRADRALYAAKAEGRNQVTMGRCAA